MCECLSDFNKDFRTESMDEFPRRFLIVYVVTPKPTPWLQLFQSLPPTLRRCCRLSGSTSSAHMVLPWRHGAVLCVIKGANKSTVLHTCRSHFCVENVSLGCKFFTIVEGVQEGGGGSFGRPQEVVPLAVQQSWRLTSCH